MNKYIAMINVNTGQIMGAQIPSVVVPENGSVNADGQLAIHVTDETLNALGAQGLGMNAFVRSFFYDISTESFVHVGEQPHPHSHYDIDEKVWVYDSAAILDEIKQQRNRTLALCDWTQVPDAPLTADQVEAWKQYRQQLRDLPQSLTTVEQMLNVQWPATPQ